LPAAATHKDLAEPGRINSKFQDDNTRRVPCMPLGDDLRENGPATVVEWAGDLDSSGCRITLDVT
jgi:hypothetical protein